MLIPLFRRLLAWWREPDPDEPSRPPSLREWSESAVVRWSLCRERTERLRIRVAADQLGEWTSRHPETRRMARQRELALLGWADLIRDLAAPPERRYLVVYAMGAAL